MTAEQFAYWMQGFSELTGDETPTPAQWKMMKEHLATVFVKVTPPLTADRIDPGKVQPMPSRGPYPAVPYDLTQRLARPGDPMFPLTATCIATPQGPSASIC
jgi:hypothetical protein